MQGIPGTPGGPPGPPGPAGQPGADGASTTTLDYNLHGSTSTPPGTGQCRLNNVNQTGATLLWANYETAPGNDARFALLSIAAGDIIALQEKDNSANWQKYLVTAAAIDSGAYATILISWQAGGVGTLPVGNNARAFLLIRAAASTAIIQDEGVALPSRNTLNFTGAGVTATDDGTRTVVTIPGASGGVPTTRQIIAGTGLSGGGDLSADRTLSLAPIVSATNAQTGTSYMLVAGDHNKIVTLSNAAAITLTVPAGLGAGFSCLIIQLGAGKVTVAASGVTIQQRQSFTKTAGQYAVASVLAHQANTFVLSGDLGA